MNGSVPAYRAVFNKYRRNLVELKRCEVAWEDNPGHIPEVQEDSEDWGDPNIYIFFEFDAPTMEAVEVEAWAIFRLYDGVPSSNEIPRPAKVDMHWGM